MFHIYLKLIKLRKWKISMTLDKQNQQNINMGNEDFFKVNVFAAI